MQLNKIISLVVGFILIILLFVWINDFIRNRRNGEERVDSDNKVVATITPTITPTSKNWYSGFLSAIRNTPQPTPKTTGTTTKTTTGIKITQLSPTPVSSSKSTNLKYTQTPTEIPETGSPSIILPLALMALGAGFYLKRS